MPDHRPTDDFLPLKPVVVQILLVLAEADSHGYGIIRAVRERSMDRIPLESGPFYRHLRRLLDDGLVAESDHRPADDDARRGAYYRLTPLGRRVLAEEGVRLAQVVAQTRSLGLIPEGTTP